MPARWRCWRTCAFRRARRPTTRVLARARRYADVYVNDAFGTAHRAHASTAGITKFVADKGIGLLMEREVKFLGTLLGEVERPFVAIIGGAKVSDKIGVLDNLLARVDQLLIGGAMANTFLKAKGGKLGRSLAEDPRDCNDETVSSCCQAGHETTASMIALGTIALLERPETLERWATPMIPS